MTMPRVDGDGDLDMRSGDSTTQRVKTVSSNEADYSRRHGAMGGSLARPPRMSSRGRRVPSAMAAAISFLTHSRSKKARARDLI